MGAGSYKGEGVNAMVASDPHALLPLKSERGFVSKNICGGLLCDLD